QRVPNSLPNAGNTTISGPRADGFSIRNKCFDCVLAMKTRIGILTSGGDCPGLNAVLGGVVLAGEKLGWEIIGFRDGFEGLLPPGDYVVLDRNSTEGIMALGGTIIGTTNRGHFIAKVGAGDRGVVASEVIARAKKVLDELH